MLPTERRRSNSPGSYGLFRDWQRTQTQSSVTAFGLETANGCPVLRTQEPQPRGLYAGWRLWFIRFTRSSEARVRRSAFSLDKDLHGSRHLADVIRRLAPERRAIRKLSELRPHKSALTAQYRSTHPDHSLLIEPELSNRGVCLLKRGRVALYFGGRKAPS
jgi:hypothetical protein